MELKEGLRKGERLQDVIESALEYAKTVKAKEHENALVLLGAQYEENELLHNKLGTLGNDTYIQRVNKIKYGLLNIINSLPNDKSSSSTRFLPLTIKRFKQQILRLIFLSRIFFFFWLAYQYQTGGYTHSERLIIIALLIPVFLVYMSVILVDLTRDNKTELVINYFVHGPLVSLFKWIMLIYTISMLYLIHLKPAQVISFEFLSLGIGIFEGLIGGYICIIIYRLFGQHTEQ